MIDDVTRYPIPEISRKPRGSGLNAPLPLPPPPQPLSSYRKTASPSPPRRHAYSLRLSSFSRVDGLIVKASRSSPTIFASPRIRYRSPSAPIDGLEYPGRGIPGKLSAHVRDRFPPPLPARTRPARFVILLLAGCPVSARVVCGGGVNLPGTCDGVGVRVRRFPGPSRVHTRTPPQRVRVDWLETSDGKGSRMFF